MSTQAGTEPDAGGLDIEAWRELERYFAERRRQEEEEAAFDEPDFVEEPFGYVEAEYREEARLDARDRARDINAVFKAGL